LVVASASLGLAGELRADAPATQADQDDAYRRHGLDRATSLEGRVSRTPAAVLELFQESGRPAPSAHTLTETDRAVLTAAIDALPPLHQRVLRDRLRVISFLDGMPNTALTSTVNPKEPFRLFDISVNAAIFRQNVSEWLTQKERTCFDAAGSLLSVRIDAGTKLGALVYVLLHEATHIVDAAERITPALRAEGEPAPPHPVAPNAFTDGVWSELSLPVPPYRDPLRARIRFYAADGGIPIDQADVVYSYLRKTPFVSLYGGRNWLDDFAEFVTVYHLTDVMKQPYRIVISDGSAEVSVYEPMKSVLVRGRIGQMKRFYQGT
jgi:hypothetical protein